MAVSECVITLLLDCADSDERLNMSVYDELSGHDAAVLAEVDSGAELIVTGLSVYMFVIL